MKDTTAAFAVHAIGDRIGIAIRAQMDLDANSCHLTPVDLHPNEGFTVEFRLGWRSAEATLIPGRFSGPMIARMGSSSSEEREIFATFVRAVLAKKTKVLMRVNSSDVAPMEWDAWPSNWSQIELTLKLTPFVVEPENEAQHERLIVDLVVPMFGMVVALIGAEENQLPTTGDNEGRAFDRIVTQYERKRLNREACIQLKGVRCLACGFDFAETYGPLGIGYIEIHHVKSLASLGPNYRINIGEDLVPVCSNCHSMAHRENPPVSLERLRVLVEERRSLRQN